MLAFCFIHQSSTTDTHARISDSVRLVLDDDGHKHVNLELPRVKITECTLKEITATYSMQFQKRDLPEEINNLTTIMNMNTPF